MRTQPAVWMLDSGSVVAGAVHEPILDRPAARSTPVRPCTPCAVPALTTSVSSGPNITFPYSRPGAMRIDMSGDMPAARAPQARPAAWSRVTDAGGRLRLRRAAAPASAPRRRASTNADYDSCDTLPFLVLSGLPSTFPIASSPVRGTRSVRIPRPADRGVGERFRRALDLHQRLRQVVVHRVAAAVLRIVLRIALNRSIAAGGTTSAVQIEVRDAVIGVAPSIACLAQLRRPSSRTCFRVSASGSLGLISSIGSRRSSAR